MSDRPATSGELTVPPSSTEEPQPSLPAGAVTSLLRKLAADPPWREAEGAPPLLPGDRLGRFELIRLLGRGGFGVVFEARDPLLGRPVAVKVIRTGDRARLLEHGLQQEAEAAARLSHPNIVTVHDLGEAAQGPFLVQELLEGRTLATRLADGRLPAGEALRVAIEVARGLAHAHGRGVVHRDLKPGNVFLCEDGRVKILDFGLAHAFGHRIHGGGTPGYMAPEQVAGAPEDERSDVYALGAILFRALSGEPPFRASGARARGDPPELEVAGAPSLTGCLGSMLAPNPARRPRDGAEVLQALLSARAELGEGARAEGTAVRVRRRTWIRQVALGIGAGLLGAALALLWLRLHSVDRQVVAVAEAVNGTGDRELDSLGSLLVTSLEESRRLVVLHPRRLRDLVRAVGSSDREQLSEAEVREAARRGGARTLLFTQVYRLGELLVLETRAIDPSGGNVAFSLREETGAKESLTGVLDRLSARVRERLGEDPGTIGAHGILLAGAVTGSLTAWSHYEAGLGCLESHVFAGTFDACLDAFRRAAEADPGFAMAHYQISRLYGMQGAPRALQKAALQPALRSIEQVAPHHQLLIRAWWASLERRDAEAQELLRRAAERSPEDKQIWWLLGEIPYRRDELPEAASAFRRAIALDPFLAAPAQQLVLSLGSTGDLEGLRELAATLARTPPRPVALTSLCYVQLWVDPGASVATCQRARQAGAGALGDQTLAIALLHAGDRDRLYERLREMAGREPPLGFAWFMRLLLANQEGRREDFAAQVAAAGDPEYVWFHGVLAEALVGFGDREGARRESLRVLELNSAYSTQLAVHLAYLGDLELAATFAPYLPPGSPRLAVYQAVVRWRGGDLRGAIAGLRPVASRSALSTDPAIPFPIYLLGEALAESGQHAEAAEILERFLTMPLDYPSWTRPRALYYLALSQERLGRRDQARATLARLLTLWSKASPGMPLVSEARALGRRLEAR